MHELTNSFHNTRTWTRYSPEQRDEIDYRAYSGTATPAELQARRRAWKTLCGLYGSSHKQRCQCGNAWGERGQS